MYCSTCGVAVAKGLSFCNYCGAKMPTAETGSESQEVRPLFIISVMAGVFVLGLPAIALIILMLNDALHLGSQQTMAFAWVTLLLLVALEFVFLMLLLRLRPKNNDARKADQFKGPQTKELEEKYAGALAEPVASVTEHTTRAFESIPRERS